MKNLYHVARKCLLFGVFFALAGAAKASQWPNFVASDSNMYIAVNNCSTGLNGALTSTTTTIGVISATCFPTVGYATIEREAIRCTGKTATSLTGCTRGSDGTTAVAHVTGKTVFHSVIAAHHNVMKDELIAMSTFFFQGTVLRISTTANSVSIGTGAARGTLFVTRQVTGTDTSVIIAGAGASDRPNLIFGRGLSTQTWVFTDGNGFNIAPNSAGTSLFAFTSAGALGVGLVPPIYTLDVAGHFRSTGGVISGPLSVTTATVTGTSFSVGGSGVNGYTIIGGTVTLGSGDASTRLSPFNIYHRVTTDDQEMTFARFNGGGNSSASKFSGRTTISVSSVTAVTVASASNYCGFALIAGDNGVDFFSDVVTFGVAGSPTTVSSATRIGSPAARTYTSDGAGGLQLKMAAGTAGTFQVNSFTIDVDSR